MRDSDIVTKAKHLAKKVIDLNYVCDRSKIDKVTLERLDDAVEHARSMQVYSGEYRAADDEKAFGES